MIKIDLDDDVLAEAIRPSGARSTTEMVNLALREYASPRRRVAAIDHYAAAAQSWNYEGWQELRAGRQGSRCMMHYLVD